MTSFQFFRSRNFSIVATVLLLHALALWGLQSGLLQRALVLVEEAVVPVTVLTEAMPKPPAPQTPVPAKAARTIQATPAATAASPAPVMPSAAQPAPLAIADATPAANAPTGVPQAPATTPAPLSVAAAAPKLDLPSSDADYLHNPKPKYPGLSISRNEQGTVRLSVLVGADGKAKEVKIKVSSGFERLDRAAREAVLGWTFVPGKRAGVPEEMWYDLPMPFKLME